MLHYITLYGGENLLKKILSVIFCASILILLATAFPTIASREKPKLLYTNEGKISDLLFFLLIALYLLASGVSTFKYTLSFVSSNPDLPDILAGALCLTAALCVILTALWAFVAILEILLGLYPSSTEEGNHHTSGVI